MKIDFTNYEELNDWIANEYSKEQEKINGTNSRNRRQD